MGCLTTTFLGEIAAGQSTVPQGSILVDERALVRLPHPASETALAPYAPTPTLEQNGVVGVVTETWTPTGARR